MSYYKRNGNFANAACVAGIHPDELAGKTITPLEAIELLQRFEEKFYEFSSGYAAPVCSIQSFLNQKEKGTNLESSYPLGLNPAPLWELLPQAVVP